MFESHWRRTCERKPTEAEDVFPSLLRSDFTASNMAAVNVSVGGDGDTVTRPGGGGGLILVLVSELADRIQ